MKSHARIRVLSLMLGDLIALSAIFLGCAALYLCFGGQYRLLDYWHLWPILPVFLCIAGAIRLYHGNVLYPGAPLAPVEELRRLFFAVTFTYLLFFAYLALSRRNIEFSRLVLLGSWFFSVLALMPMRGLVRWILKSAKIGQIPVLIAGGGITGRMLESDLRENSYYGFTPVGFVDDAPVKGRLGSLAEAVSVARQTGVSVILCCLPFYAVQKHLRDYMSYFSHVSIMSDEKGFPISWAYPIHIGGIPGLELSNMLRQSLPRTFKQLLEGVLALVGLVCLWPLFAVLALAVKFSSAGPILYKAKRLGQYGRTIEVWKFRTMYADADRKLEELLARDPKLAAEWRMNFKLDNDPRITPLGRFLRKTSLDELPQLFNVLRGEMAMIGPRPIVEAEKAYYGDVYEVFCRVKPGITGLWQVSGRSETSYARRVSLDLYYVFNWSIWLDLYILEMTFLEVTKCRGAK